MRRQIGLFALAAAAALGAVARDVTGLVVADGTVTVTLDAGSENSTNAIYFAWNNLGTDSGSNPSAWENILRIGLVPAEATSHSFELPTLLTGQFACRVFLASTTNTYDHLLSEVQTTGKQWVKRHGRCVGLRLQRRQGRVGGQQREGDAQSYTGAP